MPGIFFAKTGSEPTADNYALAYAQRRSWAMWSWLYGAILAATGAVYAIVSQLVGEDFETGVIMALLGLAIAALGWLASATKRFSRKIPKPAMDVLRREQAIRINRVRGAAGGVSDGRFPRSRSRWPGADLFL